MLMSSQPPMTRLATPPLGTPVRCSCDYEEKATQYGTLESSSPAPARHTYVNDRILVSAVANLSTAVSQLHPETYPTLSGLT